MYFPSNDERRWIELALQADARQIGVTDELRGWRWHQPPLRPIYRSALDPAAISARECPTGRDLYLADLGSVATGGSIGDEAMLKSVTAAAIQEAKQLIHLHGARSIDHLEKRVEQAHRQARFMAEHAATEIEMKVWTMRTFELRRVLERVVDVVARFGKLGPEAVAAHALPLSLDLPVDGRCVGLGAGLMADAVCWSDMTVYVLGNGPAPAEQDELRTTAIALALESASGRPVDVGCVVFARVVEGHVEVRRDYHLIGDEHRQLFIEQRDDLMRVVESGIDPGLPSECPATCGYLSVCRPALGRMPGGVEREEAANLPTFRPPVTARPA